MGSVLKSIQAVLEAGMCIFPCRPDKTPYVRWKEQASYDKRQVRDWWKQWPQAMIGLPTGRENGVWALDIDRHKEDADGFSSLAALEAANGSLPETWTQTTPSGGEHRIFKYPEGLPEETKIPNSAGALGPGLDVRGDGGYIILAPSRTNDERAYQTIRGAEFLHSAPVWLLNMAARSAGPEEDMTAPDMASRDEPAATSNLNDREKRYLEAAIKAELKNVRSALAGGRNDALNKAAFALGQFVGGGCLEQDAVKRDLLAAATAARPDASPGLPEEEAATTIDSGLTAGLNEPRKISLSPLPAGFVMLTDGLYYIAGQKKQWLGAPIEILGHVRDEANEGWGLQVRWQDLNGIAHRATIQNSSLVGEEKAWLTKLATGGWKCSPDRSAKNRLAEFFSRYETNHYLRTVDRTGWHRNSFVLPDGVLTGNAEPLEDEVGLCLVSPAASPWIYQRGGTLNGWKATVGEWSRGNSRLMMAICSALAAPLLAVAGLESGGFNFIGGSSIGKTTALLVAASVWGRGSTSSGFLKSWRATSNSLEGMAALHNDSLLCLDELGQAPGKTVSEAAYMLANETGKGRANREGNAKAVKVWRLLFLSTGEMGLADKIKADGGQARAGQEVRLIDLPADAERGYGLFEDLHGFNKPHEFSEALKQAAATDYGWLAPEFINSLIDKRVFEKDMRQYVEKTRESLCLNLGTVDGQVQRVAGRFALCFTAGILAIILNLLPWEAGDLRDAISACFRSWLERRGTSGPLEETKILAQVELFIERHGSARFQDLSDLPERTCHNRAGYKYHNADSGRLEYYVLPEVFKTEVCQGFDVKMVCGVLLKVGRLVKKEKDRLTSKTPKEVKGESYPRCYLLSFVSPKEGSEDGPT